jgi:hypothetical protein
VKVIVGVGILSGKEVVDQGHGGGKNVLWSVTVCVANVPLVMLSGLVSSMNVIGAREMLGKRVVEAFVAWTAVMFQFHHEMTDVVTAGIENVVVWTVRPMVSVTVGCPLIVIVVVVVQATSIAVVKGSIENVVAEGSVEGATIRFRGAIPVAVFDFGFATAPAI